MQSDKEKLEAFLHENINVKYIRLQWIDYSGVLRARFVPVSRCLQIAIGNESACLAQNSMIIPISTAPRIFSISNYHETWYLRPDWSSLLRCGFQVSHATLMSFVDQKDAEIRFNKCPRTLLAQTLSRFEKQWNLEFLLGFEIEFVLLDGSDNVIKPLDRLNGYSRTAGLRAKTLDLVEEITDTLRRSSIGVHHFHVEAFDQLEISLAPESVMKAVDNLILAQETIRTVCIRRDLKATMTPKPTMSGPFNGLHLHLSVNNLKSSSADSFIAGVLNHMSSLCAFGMANYDSYVRSADDAAGKWVGFGTDNRDMPVRKIGDQHWEFRMMDSTSNPYLFVAAVLLAALDGVTNKTPLTWKDCKFFPSSMDEKMRIEHGITKKMPVSLKEALDHLRSDDDFRTWIGDELLTWYLSVKDKEVEEFAKMTDEQRRLRFLEYF